MTKSVIAILLLVVMLFSCTYATTEDLTGMSTEDLLDLRLQINNELAARYEPVTLEGAVPISEIFPDHGFALFVRDEVGAFSIKDTVTQDALDRITNIFINSSAEEVKSIEGIQYLRNVERVTIVSQKGLTDIPDEICELQALRSLELATNGIKSLPDSICNCPSLVRLEIDYNPIDHLPDDIGNLSTLEYLDISGTNIKELPQSIYLLQLKEFGRKGLDLGD